MGNWMRRRQRTVPKEKGHPRRLDCRLPWPERSELVVPEDAAEAIGNVKATSREYLFVAEELLKGREYREIEVARLAMPTIPGVNHLQGGRPACQRTTFRNS